MLDESQLAVGRGWVMRATNGMEQLPGPMGFWVATAHERSDEGSSGERAGRTRAGLVMLCFQCGNISVYALSFA